MKHFSLGILCAVLLVSLAACGSSNSIPGIQDPGITDSQAPHTLVSKEGFSLSVLDSSFEHGGDAEFSLEITNTDSGQLVSIITDAQDLRTVHMRLDYDSARLHPVEAGLAAWPGLAAEEQISLAVSDIPGSVHLGSTIVHPQSNSGPDGNFSVASISFANGPMSAGRQAAAVPQGSSSRIPDLSVDAGTGDLSFSYSNVGDYDQNSEVGIADITPLGVNFNADPSGGDSYPFSSALSVVDGDSNGLITLADITPIGVNFGNQIASWTLYGGPSEDYPEDGSADNGAAQELGSILFADDSGLSKAEFRARYETTLAGIPTSGETSFWLRPVSEGNEGISSNLSGAGAADTTAPFWVGGAPEDAGVMSVIPGDGSMRVNWYEADDTQSWPGTYTVYYNEGTVVDFDTASTMEVSGIAKDDEDATSEQTAVIPGLSNETEYAFAVRVRDGADPANSEENMVMISGTPHASQELPAVIDADLTIDGPATVGNGNTVEFSNDAKLTVNGDLTIDGTIHGADTDICIVVKGELIVNGTIDQDLEDDPLVPADDAKSIKIVAEGDATFDGTPFDSNGNIQIVSDEDDILSPEDATEDIDNGDFEEFDYTFMPLDGAAPSGISAANRSASNHVKYYGPGWTWHMKNNWGVIPVQPRHVKRVVLRVYQRRGQIKATDWNITGPSGRDGAAVTNCNTAVGEDGEDNRWRMRMHASRQITLNNATITLGDGGAGGAANALACCPFASATGGNGGDSNNKYRITAGNRIVIQNNFTMNPGWGGNGGAATATGGDGADGCPAEDGCAADATGGNGGAVPRWGMRVRGAVFGGANIILGKAFGGDGGLGDATGGDGGDDTCCGTAGDGGAAIAIGGDGGSAKYTVGSGFTGTGGGSESGTGGLALATGGNGGNGASCFKAQAGNGGDGGSASAAGGLKGPAEDAAVEGDDGDGDALGGDGGNGGDGFPVGAGGAGGVALAVGMNVSEVNGSDGAPGNEWPVGGLWIWCIDIPSLVPDFPDVGEPPIRLDDGFTTDVTLLDIATMEPIGTVPFTVHDSTENPGSGVYIFMNNDEPTNPRPEIQINNNEDPEDSIQIDIELIELSLIGVEPVCVTGAQFDVSQSGFFVPTEVPANVEFFETDPFNPVGGGFIPPVPYVPGESTPIEITPDPALPDGDPTFNMGISVSPLSFLNLFTIYIIDP